MPDLMLLRHAKSDWKAAYGTDRDRPLNKRGIRSARAVGEFVSRYRLMPELVLASPAVRTRTTAELAAEAGAWNSPIEVVPKLYGADYADVIPVGFGMSTGWIGSWWSGTSPPCPACWST